MNIFILDNDPVVAAQMLCDKHVPKMIVESAQMLSTAHRVLDGVVSRQPSKSGSSMVKSWELPDQRETWLYKAVHINHPCTVWTCESCENYQWHYNHFIAICNEYTHRYDKVHASYSRLHDILMWQPRKIPIGHRTPFRLAMKSNPECMFADPVESYRVFYQTKQSRFSMKWSKRDIPEWFKVENTNV